MSDVAASSASLPAVAHPPTVSLGELWPWTLFAIALLMLLYVVGIEEGASAIAPGNVVHEFVHDGRHLLGFPCH